MVGVRQIGALWICVWVAACGPRAERPHPAALSAQSFLDACRREDPTAWRSLLVETERSDLAWAPTWSADAKIVGIEIGGAGAVAQIASTDPSVPMHPLVLRLENGSWRIALRQSLVAWAVDPRNQTARIARQ